MFPQRRSSYSGRPIRLAYIVHTFDLGGLERCVARLVNGLDRERFRPIIVCLNRGGTAEQWIERADVPVVALHKRTGNEPRLVAQLAQVLRERRIDVVHSHNWGTLIETALARRLARDPVHVHAERGMELDALRLSGWRARWRTRARQWALRRADAVVTVAHSIRDLLEREGLPPDRVQIIPNGVHVPHVGDPVAERRRLRAALGIGDDALVVGSVGRLAPVKDFGCAVGALADLAGRGRDSHLVLVGDGREREALARRASQLRVSRRVHLVGEQRNIGSWLAGMDIYFNSSLNEGMSQSIVEAMAFGLPLVVTDVGDNRLLVDGPDGCGRVVPASDPAAMAAALDELAGAARLRGELAQRARQRFLERYTLAAMVSAYEGLYQSLVAAQRGQRTAAVVEHEGGNSQIERRRVVPATTSANPSALTDAAPLS